jgi:hypothetical protein
VMSSNVLPWNTFGTAYLLVVCDNKLAVFSPCHTVGLSIVLHADSSLTIMLVYLEDATVWDIGEVEAAIFVPRRPFKKDILEVSGEASTPISVAFAARFFWYARQDLCFDDWRDWIEIHVCFFATTSCWSFGAHTSSLCLESNIANTRPTDSECIRGGIMFCP